MQSNTFGVALDIQALDEQIRLNESRSCQHLHQHAGNCPGHALLMWYLVVSTKQPTPFHEGMNLYLPHDTTGKSVLTGK